MLAYIDAGTAAAIAAVATGGLAGAKVAAQSVFFRFKSSKKAQEPVEEQVDEQVEPSELADASS